MLVHLLFLLLVLILLYWAVRWEASDIRKLYAKKPLRTLPKKSRVKELTFYATYNSENNIMWRSLFISAVIISVLLYLYLKNYGTYNSCETHGFVILFSVFLTSYMMHIYRTFHIYRVMTSKVRSREILDVIS
jgi:hypothetical protein